MAEFTHLDEEGRARMVDVTAKAATVRTALAGGEVRMRAEKRVEPQVFDLLQFLLRNLAVGAIAGGLELRYFYVRHQWRRNVEAEAQSRVRALQARIRPHFLFNSMNTIASLTRSNPRLAEQAIADLADLFRASLRDPGMTIPSGSRR